LQKVGNAAKGALALKNMAAAAINLVTNCEPVHDRILQSRMVSSADTQQKRYHRFNVDRDMEGVGLEEWRRMDEIADHTSVYMDSGDGPLRRNKCVQVLMATECK
jgi:hypothetical protein